jgi:hypothetical protein
VAFLDRAIPDRVAKQTDLPEHAVAWSGVMRVAVHLLRSGET